MSQQEQRERKPEQDTDSGRKSEQDSSTQEEDEEEEGGRQMTQEEVFERAKQIVAGLAKARAKVVDARWGAEEVIANEYERYEIENKLDFIELKLTEVEKQIEDADKWLD